MFDVKLESAFNFLSGEYAELFSNSAATAFQHPHWLDAVYTRLAPQQGAEPVIVTVRAAADGRLAMVLPLVRQRHGIMRVIQFADLRVSDYAAAVVADGAFDAIVQDVSACEGIRAALKPFDILRIQKLRGDSAPIERLLGAPAKAPMGMSAHAVALQRDFAAWRAANMAASYCKELDKKSRQLHRKGSVSFECSTSPEAIEATFRQMRDYRRPRFEGRGDGDLLQHQAYFDFYLDIAIRSRAVLSRIYTLTMDGRPIAGVMGLAHDGRFLVILGGFDLSTYKNQSIGSLMFEQVARDCIERGDRELDFTIGDEPYKSLFGARASSMYMVSRANSPLGAIVGLAVEQAPWIKAVAKRLMPRGRAGAPLPPAVASIETAAES